MPFLEHVYYSRNVRLFGQDMFRTFVCVRRRRPVQWDLTGGDIMPKDRLSRRQAQIYEFICGYTGEHGYPPSVREIGAAVGLASPSTVHMHLKVLQELGYIKRDSRSPVPSRLCPRAAMPHPQSLHASCNGRGRRIRQRHQPSAGRSRRSWDAHPRRAKRRGNPDFADEHSRRFELLRLACQRAVHDQRRDLRWRLHSRQGAA